MFKAICNVSIGLQMYRPGEEIPDVPKKMQKWLLEQGAIQKMGAPIPMLENDNPPVDPLSLGDDADGAEEDEGEDEAEATPEIDVMDGIVADEAPANGRSKGK